jgi:hypothetical protein
MNDKTFKIAIALILVSGACVIYLRVQKNKGGTDVDTIVSSGASSNKTVLQTLQPEYLKAWAEAIKANVPTFTFNAKKYNTTGGKAIK